jgi:hypothetical protein
MFSPILERMASKYSTTISRLRSLQLNMQLHAKELDLDCERLVKPCSTTKVEFILNFPSDNDDINWGNWCTVSLDSDDSDDDSDEINLHSHSERAATPIVRTRANDRQCVLTRIRI